MPVIENRTRPYQILVVEDNPADMRLIREAFRETRAPKALHMVEDGVDAMAFLRREPGYEQSPRPDLVLLDLNLPRKNGVEVLAEMRLLDRLSMIPVIVFSTSSSQDDIQAAYRSRANCFVSKPSDLDDYFETIHSIDKFWLQTVRLPELDEDFSINTPEPDSPGR